MVEMKLTVHLSNVKRKALVLFVHVELLSHCWSYSLYIGPIVLTNCILGNQLPILSTLKVYLTHTVIRVHALRDVLPRVSVRQDVPTGRVDRPRRPRR